METKQLASIDRQFYPTPPELVEKMLEIGQVKHEVKSILEPSAGKGDMIQGYIDHFNADRNAWNYHHDLNIKNMDVDCVEIDPDLQSVLRGKGFRVVHDDFLTFHTYKSYDLILMNPPFAQGAEHLLKALEIMRYGGKIICVLNAETILNPFSYARKQLAKKIEEHSATIEFVSNAFTHAERQTEAQIAIVYFNLPVTKSDSTILEGMKKAEEHADTSPLREHMDLAQADFIEAIINRFNYEARCGIKLIEEYSAVEELLKQGGNSEAAMSLTFGSYNTLENVSVNNFMFRLRKKFWNMLFASPQFVQQMTTNLRNDLYRRLNEFAQYEFSAYNIYHLALEMNNKVNGGIRDTIIKLFDDWTHKYHYDENSQNRWYYDGWKTNDAFAVNKRVIIPMYGFYSIYSDSAFGYEAIEKLEDIQKVFDYLDAGRTDPYEIRTAMEEAKKKNQTRNITCKYFKVSLYKKGTAHIEFTNQEVLDKFNIFAAMEKKWLPPSFGKKHYKEMDKEEQAVIDSFSGGEQEYEKVVKDAEYYLPSQNTMMLLGA